MKQIFFIIILSLITISGIIFAGSLTPTTSPGSSLVTLTDLYNKITDNTYSLSAHTYAPASTAATHYTLQDIYNLIASTTSSLDPDTIISPTIVLGLAGTYDVSNLTPDNVRLGITYGTSSVGTKDPCGEVATCSGPDDCYTNESLKTAGSACLNGEILRWSAPPIVNGYGHWYKDGEPNIHLVDNWSSPQVKAGSTSFDSVYVDLTNVGGEDITGNRAGNGLYYKEIPGTSYAPGVEFGSLTHAGNAKNADQCNYLNAHTPDSKKDNVCGIIGLRLPRIRETTNTMTEFPAKDSCDYAGGPAISGANGVPSNSESDVNPTTAASAVTTDTHVYWNWKGSGTYGGNFWYSQITTSMLVCVIP